MTDTKRLIANTLAQNVRTILNIVLSLYSTRIVIDALGQSDYGIYMLVAGVVSLLSYLVNALVTTTQRHLSFYFGQNDIESAQRVFANSYILHWIFASALCFFAVLLTSAIFDYGWMNVPTEKIAEAKWVYVLVLMSVFLTFITAPFRALLIAHENIVYISIVDILDGFLKLGLVFSLYLIADYRLSLYSFIIAFIMLTNLILLASYSAIHYTECILMPRLSLYRKNEMKKTIGFATWTLYGTACVFVRTQGLAVILNRFYGTIINASYGIGAQIFGSIQFLSEAIIHAIRPQITKAEGRGERKKMLSMSLKTCKCCYLIMAIVTIPLLVEMDSVLTFWLGKVPYNATLFCRIMLLAALIDQITIGLNVANTAIGRIRNFTIFVFTTKALAVPVGLSLLKYGYGIHSVMYSYLFFEVLSGIIRVPYLKRNAGLAIADYFEQVLLKISVPTICMFTVCLCISQYCHLPLRFIISGIVNGVTGVIIMYLTATTSEERHLISNYIYEHFYRNK